MHILKGITDKNNRDENNNIIQMREINIEGNNKLVTIDGAIYYLDKENSVAKFLEFNSDKNKILHLNIEGLPVNIEHLEEISKIRLTTLLDATRDTNTLNIIYRHNWEELINDIIVKTKCVKLEETIATELKYLSFREVTELKELKITQCETLESIKNAINLEKFEADEILYDLNLETAVSSLKVINVEYCNYLTGKVKTKAPYFININECTKVNCEVPKSTEINIRVLEILEHVNNDANIKIKQIFMCSNEHKDMLKEDTKLFINNINMSTNKSTTLAIDEECTLFSNALVNKEIDTLIFNKKTTLLNHKDITIIPKESTSILNNLIFEDTASIFLDQFKEITIRSLYVSANGAEIIVEEKCSKINVENILIDADKSTQLKIDLKANESHLKYLSINIKDKTDYCLDNSVLENIHISENQVESLFLRGNFILDNKIKELASASKKLTITGKLVIPPNTNIPDNIVCKETVTEKQDRITLGDHIIGKYSALDLIRMFNVRDNSKSINELAEGIYNKFLTEVV